MGVPRLVGMVHLDALPGAPSHEVDLDEILARAVSDATTLADAGFGGVMIENYGDAPFYRDQVPPVTVAAMTRAVDAVRSSIDIPVGVNVLRNDVSSALAIAAVTGAGFVRVNVLSGTMYTDQGPIIGRAADVLRLRRDLAPDVAIMADVFVKHATPPPGLRLEDATRDLAGRGGADVVVVSGSGTGSAPDLERVRTVKRAASDTPVYVGSGASVANAAEMLAVADGCIVGTATKPGGETTNAVDPELAKAFVVAAG